MIYLEHYNNNHYNTLIPKTASKTLITLGKSINLEETEVEEWVKKKVLKTQPNPNKNKKRTFSEKSGFQEETSSNSKDKFIVELYPNAKNNSNAYNEAYQFLKYSKHPARIKSDKAFRNWVKDINYRYELINKAENRHTKSRLMLKGNERKDRKLKMIPYKNEIETIIEQAHNGFSQTKIKHNGINMTKRNIQNQSIYWAGMKKDISDYINNCIDCINQTPIHPIKISKCILADGPLDRFTADCWQIPQEMVKASGIKYLHVLTCIDHFSKFKWTELLPSKTAKEMVSKMEYIFNYFGNPKKFQTDNGREFVNEEVKNLCKIRNIDYIHGRPYHPQSQGVVEKVNDFVAQSLKASYIDYKKQKKKELWDIESALKSFTANANRNVHSVTLKVPNRLIFCEDQNEIESIKKRIETYYSLRSENKKLDLEIGTKVYIIKKLTKTKNKQSLVYRHQKICSKLEKHIKVRIPCIIEDISGLKRDQVKVKVIAKPTEGIIINNIYNVCICYLEIATSEKSWNIIVKN